MQFYRPETFTIQRDVAGRISALGDNAGNRVEFTYKPAVAGAPMQGDPGMKLHAFASVALTGRDPHSPWRTKTVMIENAGWILLGLPNGEGRATGPDASALEQRYRTLHEQARQLGELDSALRKQHTDHPQLELEAIAQFGAYAAAFEAMAQGGNAQAGQGSALFYRSLMSHSAGAVAQQPAPASALLQVSAASGAGRLPTYDPSGGAAQPGNTGKQRLGQSNSDDCGDDFGFARGATKGLSKASTVAWKLGTGSKAPWAIPLKGVMKIIDFQFDHASKINDALAGRYCPKKMAEHTHAATVLPIERRSAVGPDFANAWNTLGAASGALVSAMGQAQAAKERYQSAMTAGDQASAKVFAGQIATGLHGSGQAMLELSSGLVSVSASLRAEGEDRPVTMAEVKAYQQALRANGFSQEDVAIARGIGMSDEAIAASLQARLEPTYARSDTTIAAMYEQAARALHELGLTLVEVQPSGPGVVNRWAKSP